VGATFKDAEHSVEFVGTAKGAALLGMKYAPLFPYFVSKVPNGFRVIHSDHVTTDNGTGVVHMAPAFGEEDYYACLQAGIPVVNPVDDDGVFTAEVADYAGRRVKDADKDIMAALKRQGRLFKQETIVHSYPFCWRSDTPLIYRAVSSWFVAVEKIKDRLLRNNQATNWVPEALRDGRFGNWLENARDWAISRNRFWGTPIPIWRNAEGELRCIGSQAELEKLSGQRVQDLHMEFVDQVELPSPTGKSPLKHIPEVLDCWFESGSMPYAQWGYPFEGQEAFQAGFPADFIAEGLDQTRGWFYTLMVIGTALFDQAPFRNVLVNGLILAEDGKKMSKSLRNYPDPNEVLDRHGADALRLYMIDSPVVKAQELRFSETGVRHVVRQILLRWWNAYSFFVSYANVDHFRPRGDYAQTPNVLDKWVLSRLNHLVQNTRTEMEAYRLFNVVPALLQFIEALTNTYIRFNRRHFWQEGMPEDKRLAYETLYHVLLTLAKTMAPFAPFLAEATYQNLARVAPRREESVHLERFPEPMPRFVDAEMEEAVQVMEALVLLGRNLRERIQVKAKIPLRFMRIIHRDPRVLEALKPFEPYFQEELNIRRIEYDSREDQFIRVSAKANFPVLGKRLGPKMKVVAAQIQKLGVAEIVRLERGETLLLEGEPIALGEVEVRRASKGAHPHLLTSQSVSIEVDPTVEREQLLEGLAREVIRKVQQARKNADFLLDDRIRLELGCAGDLAEAVQAHRDLIQRETLATEFQFTDRPSGQHVEAVELDEGVVRLGVTRLTKARSAAR
jgi:isoleucyl-tRNA synthetase